MSTLLHEFHQSLGARFTSVNGAEIVADYGDALAEHAALRTTAGVLDLSSRSRICLVGADRARYLHGQVTNEVKKLVPGTGIYATVTTAKGKMEADLNILSNRGSRKKSPNDWSGSLWRMTCKSWMPHRIMAC